MAQRSTPLCSARCTCHRSGLCQSCQGPQGPSTAPCPALWINPWPQSHRVDLGQGRADGAAWALLDSPTIARGPAHPLRQTALPAAPLGMCTVNWLAGFPREGVGPGWGNPISALGLCTPSPGPAGSPGAVPTVAAAGSGTRCPPDSQGSGCSYGKCGTSVSASVWSRMFPDGRKVQAGSWQGAGHCVSA